MVKRLIILTEENGLIKNGLTTDVSRITGYEKTMNKLFILIEKASNNEIGLEISVIAEDSRFETNYDRIKIIISKR